MEGAIGFSYWEYIIWKTFPYKMNSIQTNVCNTNNKVVCTKQNEFVWKRSNYFWFEGYVAESILGNLKNTCKLWTLVGALKSIGRNSDCTIPNLTEVLLALTILRLSFLGATRGVEFTWGYACMWMFVYAETDRPALVACMHKDSVSFQNVLKLYKIWFTY